MPMHLRIHCRIPLLGSFLSFWNILVIFSFVHGLDGEGVENLGAHSKFYFLIELN